MKILSNQYISIDTMKAMKEKKKKKKAKNEEEERKKWRMRRNGNNQRRHLLWQRNQCSVTVLSIFNDINKVMCESQPVA